MEASLKSVISFLLSSVFMLVTPLLAQQQIVSDAPEVRTPFTLSAVYDSSVGHNAFSYAGNNVPPTIRVSPGSVIKVRYENKLPVVSHEKCVDDPCVNISNLHFHGMHVSPERPQDDVLTMLAHPGQSLSYRVKVPPDAAPGLYWYHTHPHEESYRQALDGMSGAIVVEGIDKYYPEVRNIRERVLVLRDREIEHDDPTREQIKQKVEIPSTRCGKSKEQEPERVFTLNGQLRPLIPIAPGERQFWRIVNASPDLYADLELDGRPLQIIALDGMPLSYHDPSRRFRSATHIFVPPAGRVEMVVTGPTAGTHATLRTRCIDSGPDGDLNPEMVIADVVSGIPDRPAVQEVLATRGLPIYRELPTGQIEKFKNSSPDFTVTFTEDKNGFYINGKKFSMDELPMLRVRVGSYQHWRVINATRELHPFHIHQVHFLPYATNGVRSTTADWLDTVDVPYGGSVDLIMDFTDPVIRGMSVFHCHLLNHEDKGMMAKILFE